MVINTRKDWDGVLSRGAVVLWETKYFKIFRMPDGKYWWVMPKWRRAWRFHMGMIESKEIKAGDPEIDRGS